MRAVDISGYPKVTAPSSFGKPARLEWISIKQLVIDPEYQREISKRGRQNIIKIAESFDWAKFAPVIVAPAGSNLFAIVDGQHRATAAALCGLDKVPCAIIDGARAAQAAAFAAINTVVTAMSTMQVHAAKLAAGDPMAAKVTAACARAGVTICRYPVPANKMKVGETLAASQLYRFFERFGEDTLVAALCCITKTGTGNAGWVKAPIIEALCAVLDAEPDWRDRATDAMQSIDFGLAFNTAAGKAGSSRQGIVNNLVDIFGEIMERHFDGEPAKPAPKPVKPRQPAVPAPSPAPEAAPPLAGTRDVKRFGDITVELTKGHEEIRIGATAKRLTWRQAEFIAIIARTYPEPVGRDFLSRKLFGGSGAGAMSDVQLDLVATDVKHIVAGMGLKLVKMPIGFALGRA